MADDLDVEAMLEAPFQKGQESVTHNTNGKSRSDQKDDIKSHVLDRETDTEDIVVDLDRVKDDEEVVLVLGKGVEEVVAHAGGVVVQADSDEEERDKRTVFVMQLAARLRTRELADFFSSAGKVRDAKIIADRISRRVGYVEFYDEESVPKALALTGQKLLGIPVIVQLTEAEKNRQARLAEQAASHATDIAYHRLYVGSVHFNLTEDDLRQVFEPFGPLEFVNLHKDPETGRYKNPEDAKQALEKMNGFELAGRTVTYVVMVALQIKVGLVTDKSNGMNLNLDDDVAGLALNAQSRVELMQKLARDTDLIAPATTPALSEMSEAEDSTLESSEFGNQASADSTELDGSIQTPARDVDKKDSDDAIKDEEKPINMSLNTKSRNIIRYTREQLLELRESPLVKKPDALPPISSCFVDGLNKSKDDLIAGISKSPLIGSSKSPNGSEPTSPKPSGMYKIILGPPKTIFASSSVGGLRSAEDKPNQARTGRSDGMRQRQDEYSRTGIKDYEPRAPRGPTGERGFVGREALRERALADKALKESMGSSHNSHSRGLGHTRSQDTNKNSRRDGDENLTSPFNISILSDFNICFVSAGGGVSGRDQLSKTNFIRHYHSEDRSETPKWMHYNPQTDEDTKNGRARSISRADSSTSWRPDNKIGTSEESSTFVGNPIPEVSQNGSKEKETSDFNVDLNAPLDSGSSAFDKFLSKHNKLAMAEDNIPKTEQGTSRFARFFSHNVDESSQEVEHKNERHPVFPTPTQGHPAPNELKPGPISLDTLFQSQAATSSTVAATSPRMTDGKRMLSRMLTEDEVLQTIGAKPSIKPESKERNYEDEAAMYKIYAALQKKSTPGVKTSQHQSKLDISNRHLGLSELPSTDSAKKINMLFGGNVPTSVYRQLSSRSDNGSRESSAASSPALKFNTKPIISNFQHSPQSSAHIHDIHAPMFKSPPPHSPNHLHQQSHNHSQYHNNVPSYSNGPNISQHSHNRPEYPPPIGRNIPVEQLFSMIPPRNVPQQVPPQFQQPPIPPQIPFGYQPQTERYPQQIQFNGPSIPHHPVHHHPGMLPP
ncbi:3131_t:CDS:10, partial [Racocetra fulgida]